MDCAVAMVVIGYAHTSLCVVARSGDARCPSALLWRVCSAASYLAKLEADDAAQYEKLMHERATAWGEEPQQPMERCVAFTLCIIFRNMLPKQRNVGSVAAATLTAERRTLSEADVLKWFKRHRAAFIAALT